MKENNLKKLYNMVERIDKKKQELENKLTELNNERESLMAEIITLETA